MILFTVGLGVGFAVGMLTMALGVVGIIVMEGKKSEAIQHGS